MPSSRVHCGFVANGHKATVENRYVRARLFTNYYEPACYISALEHRCRNHPSFPLLEYHFGTQAYVHDMIFVVKTAIGTSRYRFFFTKHCRLPVNPAIHGVEWRGCVAVFRAAKEGRGCVNIRAGETVVIDKAVSKFTTRFVAKKRYPRICQIKV